MITKRGQRYIYFCNVCNARLVEESKSAIDYKVEQHSKKHQKTLLEVIS